MKVIRTKMTVCVRENEMVKALKWKWKRERK